MFQKFTQDEHIYRYPEVYIGESQPITITEWIYENNDNTISTFKSKSQFCFKKQNCVMNYNMMRNQIEYIPACKQIFMEILKNACEYSNKSDKYKPVEIIMNDDIISIINYGSPIPIQLGKNEKVYIPELILGTLRTSSNYNYDDYHHNGMGAKVVNIFSKHFQVYINDANNHLTYVQDWYNNMKERTDPIITDYNGEISSVKITWCLDFERFHFNKYSDDYYKLFKRLSCDASFIYKVPINFNNHLIDYRNINDYGKLFINEMTGDESKTLLLTGDEYELLFIKTIDEPFNISFANGQYTRNGGVHVDSAYNALKGVIGDEAELYSLILNLTTTQGVTFGNQNCDTLVAPIPQIMISESV